MNIQIKYYENAGSSPAWTHALRAVGELERLGYTSNPPSYPDQNDAILVATDKHCHDAVVGLIAYRPNPMNFSWWIMLSWTRPDYRNKGIHSRLFNTLVTRAKSRGDILSIESGTHPDNKSAQASFKKQGRELSVLGYRYEIRPHVEGKDPFKISS